MNQDDKTDQEIADDDSEDTGESTISSDIEEDNLDHPQKFLHLCQARWDKSLRTIRVPLPKKWISADTVIAGPLLQNSRNLPAAMAPPLRKHQKSSLLNKISESDSAPAARALVPSNKSSGGQNCPQPKASIDHNVRQHQKATFEVAKKFIQAIVLMNTPGPILSDVKYSMVEEAWKLAIEAQDHQQALGGAPVGTQSLSQLPGSPSLIIDPQTRQAVNS